MKVMSTLFQSRRSKAKNSSKKVDTEKVAKTSFKTKLKNRIGHWNFKKITQYMLLMGFVLLSVTGYFWYTRMYMTAERRFYLALENSMATPSVVRTLSQGGSGNQVVQQYRFHFSPQRAVENKVVFTEKSATTDTEVATEGIVFPTEQFLRYSYFRDSRSDAETTANIDSLLGAWAKQEMEDPEQAALNYLSEQVSLVIFGNYGPSVRTEMIKQFKERQVYGTELNKPANDTSNGEATLLYAVAVDLRDYAELLNKAFVLAGYGEFAPLNPDNYEPGSIVNGSIVVRKRDNAVVGVNFGGREERYGNYGVIKQVERPESTMTVEELQSEVQRLLQ
jgi:hypothetical protein